MFIELPNGEIINTDHISNMYRDDHAKARPWALVYGHTLRHYSQGDYDKIKDVLKVKAALVYPDGSEAVLRE
jgi:hypothetical protein